jgi:hypothetical protein
MQEKSWIEDFSTQWAIWQTKNTTQKRYGGGVGMLNQWSKNILSKQGPPNEEIENNWKISIIEQYMTY